MKRLTMFFVILTMITVGTMQAAELYWNGSVDNLYTNEVNWDGGVLPINNDYSDKIYFNDTNLSGVMSTTSTLTSERKINSIIFDNSGYSILGSQIQPRAIESYGSGTNYINSIKMLYQSSITSGTGNTLNINYIYQNGDKPMSFEGGGTVIFNTYFDGWGTPSQTIKDARVIVKSSKVYKDNYITILTLDSSELQLLTTVTAAESLITAGKITESTGRGLDVTDIGDGYVSIKLAPVKIPGTIIFVD